MGFTGDRLQAAKPRCSAEPSEDFASFGTKWSQVIEALLGAEPFAMLQQGDRQPEGERHFTKSGRGSDEALIGAGTVASATCKASLDAKHVCIQEARPASPGQIFNQGQDLVRRLQIISGECPFHRQDE